MDIKELRKGLRNLKNSIEDFLDNMELDGDPETKPAEKKASDKKFSSDVEEDEDGKKIGEIVVRGPNVMKGYFQDEEATAEVMDGAWFRTGDYGYLDEDGYIYITGRKKNVIVLNNGKNVFPEEIEEYLEKVDLVKECVVIGRKIEEEIVVTALIYPDFDKARELGFGEDMNEVGVALKEKIADLNRSLPSFKQIREMELRRTEFEKTTSKKIIRHLIK